MPGVANPTWASTRTCRASAKAPRWKRSASMDTSSRRVGTWAPSRRRTTASLSRKRWLAWWVSSGSIRPRPVAWTRRFGRTWRSWGMAGEWREATIGELAWLHDEQVTPTNAPAELFHHFSIPAYDSGQKPAVEPGSAIGSNKYVVQQ